MVNKYMKKCSISVVIWKMKMNVILTTQLLEWVKLKPNENE